MIRSVAYYAENEELLTDLLDEMVERVKPEPGDIPSFTFASLVTVFEKDPAKAATIAALAVMRLAEMKRAAADATGGTS